MNMKQEEMQLLPGEGEMILARNQYYSMDDFQTQRNNNVLVVGAAGCGKTRGVVSPNLLQATGSYIVSDPKGSLLKKYGLYLMGKGYRVINIDFTNPGNSDHYNPLAYVRKPTDILKVAHMLAYNKSTQERKGGDSFWEQAAELLFSALIAYLVMYRPEEEQTLGNVAKLVCAGDGDENRPDQKTPLDRIMDEVEKRDYNSFCLKQYRKYRLAAGRTLASVQISCNVKLNAFDLPEIVKMAEGESIDFTKVGQEKTAVFVCVSDTDRSLDDLANLFFTQAMNELVRYADSLDDGRLPVPVRFILDDFATNVMIDDFQRVIASIRSRAISVMLCVQDEAQLSAAYQDHGNTIVSNCDTYLYLGGNDRKTEENVSTRADLPPHRVLNMKVGTGILFRRGEDPVCVKGFDLEAFENSRRGKRYLRYKAGLQPPEL